MTALPNPDKTIRTLLRVFKANDPTKTGTIMKTLADQKVPPDTDVTCSFEFLSILPIVNGATPAFAVERLDAATKGFTPLKVAFEDGTPVPIANDPWGWKIKFKIPAGTQNWVVHVTCKCEQKHPRTGASDVFDVDMRFPSDPGQTTVPLNTQTTAQAHIPAPRLIKSFNTTEVLEPDPDAVSMPNPSPDDIAQVLDHIWKRLDRGIEGMWLGPDGQQDQFGLSILTDLPITDGGATTVDFLQGDELEEAWAQTIAQILLELPYVTPTTAYSGLSGYQLSDEHLYAKTHDKLDPAYAVAAECQHLCTMAAIARGLPLATMKANPGGKWTEDNAAFTAGDGSQTTVQKIGGSWNSDASLQQDIKKAINSGGLKPGSCFTFNGSTTGNAPFKGNTGGAHIGFVLRVHPDKLRMQFLDTGAMNSPGPEPISAIFPAAGSKAGLPGNHDFEWITSVVGPQPPSPGKVQYVGLANLPDPANMKAAVKQMRRARPLGLARLLLVNRKVGSADIEQAIAKPVAQNPAPKLSLHTAANMPAAEKSKGFIPLDKWLVYATPMLLTYGPSERDNFHLSRYIWSLRKHPGRKDIMAIWLIDTPRGELADAAIGGIDPTSKLTNKQKLEASPPPSGQPNWGSSPPRSFGLVALLAQAHALIKRRNPRPPKNFLDPNASLHQDTNLPVLDFVSQDDENGSVYIARRFNALHINENLRPDFWNMLPWGVPSGAMANLPASKVPRYFGGTK